MILCKLTRSGIAVGILLAGGLACTGAEPAEPTVPGAELLTLQRAIRLAVAHNPELRVSSAQLEAATGRAIQARKWSNPELELAAEEWPVDGGGGFSDAKQTVGVSQSFPWPGKKSLDKRVGGAGVRVSGAELEVRRLELVREVKTAFFRVLAAEQQVTIAKELLAVADSSAQAAGKRVAAGATPYQEQLRAEVQLEQARSELAGAERDAATAHLGLAARLGEPSLARQPVSGSLAEVPEEGLLQNRQNSSNEHPFVRAAQARLEQRQLEARRARLDPYPDIKAGVAGGRLGDTDESIVELRFSFPLPLLDRSQGRTAEATANVATAEAQLEVVVQRLRTEREVSRERYRVAARQVATYRERILPKATEALRLVRTGFDEGKFGFIDLLDTQRTTAEARRAYQEKLLEMNVAQAELESILGMGIGAEGKQGSSDPRPQENEIQIIK